MPVSQHTLVAGEAFFENEYLSVGINAFGAYGTANAAPGGYAIGGSSHLGMFGYGVNPGTRDAVEPGRPFDVFTVAHDGVDYSNGSSSNGSLSSGYSGIAGSVADQSTTAMDKAKWSSAPGQAGGLQVQQTTTMSPTDHYTTIKVTLKNTTGATMHNVDYLKVSDPDLTSSTTNTNNIVFAQAGGSKPVHGVAGYTVDDAGQYGSTAFFLYTKDIHATASTNFFANTSQVDAYSSGLLGQAQGHTELNSDNLENLLFQFGDLAPGASVSFTYYEGVTDALPQEISKLGNHPTFASDGDDVINGFASTTKFNIDMGHGDDFITGSTLADVIQGGAGNDQIWGYGGNDVLMGGAGDDQLIADSFALHKGQVTLYGGSGADSFYFVNAADTAVKKPDQVMDFSHAQGDKINLQFLEDTSGQLLHLAAGFDGSHGALVQVATTGGVLIEGDLNGDLKADFSIFVASHTGPLAAGDFVL